MDKFSELKAAAMAATPQKIDGAQEKTEDGCMECPCCSGDGQVDVGADYCNYDNTAIGVIFYGIGDAHVAAERYFRAANPATVLALLAELEASKKSNAFLKEQLAKLANFNPDWDMLEACRESWREVAAALKEAEARLEAKDKRIAELEEEFAFIMGQNDGMEKELRDKDARIEHLEAKLATPVRLLGEMLPHEWERAERQAAFEHRKIAWDARLAEDKKAILAAGFTFTVEGDE